MIKISNTASNISFYSYKPQNKKELKKLIKERISKEGPKCDLCDIDTSLITDMSEMFYFSEFNGDISNWDVSNVKRMSCMFFRCAFNGDISGWDVSNVEDMYCMFFKSDFNGDISRWDVSNVKYTEGMFVSCFIEEEFKPKSLRKK